jgi:hypothetical protein
MDKSMQFTSFRIIRAEIAGEVAKITRSANPGSDT